MKKGMGNVFTGDGTAILCGHPSHKKVKSFAEQRQYLHFSVTLYIQTIQGIELSTSHIICRQVLYLLR